jgi:hypothetical protein
MASAFCTLKIDDYVVFDAKMFRNGAEGHSKCE